MNSDFQIHATDKSPPLATSLGVALYKVSWVNRLNDRVQRLPWNPWMTYLGIGLGFTLVPTIVLWIEGTAPVGTFLPIQVFLSAVIAYFLGLIHFLDRGAGAGLADLRPAMKVKEEQYQELHFRLTRLPGVATVLASLIALVFVFLSEIPTGPFLPDELRGFPASTASLRIVYLICWWIFGTVLYHTIYQLRIINHIYTRYTIVDLFRMEPLYAFANLSAITAGSLIVIPYGFLAINRYSLFADPFTFFLILGILGIALLTFLLPQLGIHRLQVDEKNRLLEEANQRMVAMITKLHECVDEGNLEEVASLNMTLNTLELEKSVIDRISTWPWQPETVRWLATALILPLGLWVFQLILGRILGPW